MGRIPYCRACHNTKRRTIFGSPEVDRLLEFPSVKPDVRDWLTPRTVALYRLILRLIPDGCSSVVLRQIDIADWLGLSAVTIRRHTGRLEKAGLIVAKRTVNSIRFSMLGSGPEGLNVASVVVQGAPAQLGERLVQGPTHDGAVRPVCTFHNASRRSKFSDYVGLLVYHCTGFVDGVRCSWLHVVGHGTVCGSGLREWQVADLVEYLNSVGVVSSSSVSCDEGTMVDLVERPKQVADPPAREHTIWRQTVERLAEMMQDHYVERYLFPTRALGMSDGTLVVQTACPQDVQWLGLPLNQRWSDNALSEVLQESGTVQYVYWSGHVD